MQDVHLHLGAECGCDNVGQVLSPHLLFVRFSCNLYFRFFLCKILMYGYKLKLVISALFWTVWVSINEDIL